MVEGGLKGIRFLLVAGMPIKEPVVWQDPIMMNRRQELMKAINDLRNGRFVKPLGH